VQKNRYGIYHFRRAIPHDLRAIIGKREITKSLQTRDPKIAVQLARFITIKTDELFARSIQTMSKKNKNPKTIKTEYGGLGINSDGFHFEGISPEDMKAMHENGFTKEEIKERLIAIETSHAAIVQQLHNKNITPPEKNSIKLSELITKYNEDRISSRGGKWKPDKGDTPKFRRLVEILDDTSCDSVTRDLARTVREKICSLPQNTNPHRKKTVHQILFDMKPTEEKMSITNINHHLTLYTSLFKWARREGLYTSENPFEGLTITDDTPNNKKRKPFTKDELTQIFTGKLFTSYDTKIYSPHHYWAPLIALFTGARTAEVGALGVNDIYQVTSEEHEQSIYVFDINTHAGSTPVKTENAIRRIPLHPKLIELGLLDYCKSVKELGKNRLFHYLKWEENSGYGRYITEHFNKYLKELDIHENRTKVFYSFRHTLATSLERARVNHDRIELISGRSSPIKKTIGQQYYISTPEAYHLMDDLMKIDFSKQIKHVKPFMDMLNNKNS